EGPACAIIKHTNPCGVATGSTLSEAYCKAFETDKVSPFGGIISFNGEVDIETAKAVHDIFTEVIIAPSFTDEALELLTSKKNRRLIAADLKRLSEKDIYDLRSVPGGWLMQESDKILYNDADLKVVSKRKPTAYEMQGLLFAWKVCKHVKSNAIVYTASDRTLAIGAGQMSRVDSSMIAVSKAKEMGLGLKNSCLASDAFFPFPDGLIAAAEAGATAVIQPGGSVRDEEVIKAADERNLAMVFTGMRHFRH
ncbi:MAG: bifunctional phosphoribosylaminoimidazolecarboxamide formyltransferase/IMP cyclohydrolase, partial [Bacteroidota bacterium]